MALTPPPPIPQRGDRGTFGPRVDAFLRWEGETLVPELNALQANLSSFAAGGAYALAYVVDLSTTADNDPGTGNLRFDNASQNAATTLRLDTLVGGADVSALLDQFDASTSAVKGSLRLQKVGDPSKWLVFDVTARAAPSGYRNITVTNRGGSGANPFVTGDGVMLFFQRSGDSGSGSLLLLASATVSTPVANIDFLNTFTSAYDTYVIEMQGFLTSTTGNLLFYFAKAGVVDTSVFYYTPVADGAAATSGQAGIAWPINAPSAGVALSATLRVRNANSTTQTKIISCQGFSQNTAITREAAYYPLNAASGFRLAVVGGYNFTAGTVRVYGIRNT